MAKNKDQNLDHMSVEARNKLNALIKEESRLVKGRFRFHEVPGGSTKVQCQKYPGVPMFSHVMTDGEVYEIPLWVARWLNGVDMSAGLASAQGGDPKIHSCAVPEHGFKWEDRPPQCGVGPGGSLVPIVGVTKWKQRMSFESMEFDLAQ